MSYKITIDRENCISCGNCEALCPSNFYLEGPENKAKVKKSVVEKITCEQQAAEACPVDVIKIEKLK